MRLPPVALDLSKSSVQTQFENGQVRILRVGCAAGQPCPESQHPNDPAVAVNLSGPHRGAVEWSPQAATGLLEQDRIELKTQPVAQTNQ